MVRRLACMLLACAQLVSGTLIPPTARLVELSEIAAVTLTKKPTFGETGKLVSWEMTLFPGEAALCIRQGQPEACYPVDPAWMDGTFAGSLQGLLALPETIQTDVLDGHFTQITIEMKGGHVVRTGGIVAERYGPQGFRAAYEALMALPPVREVLQRP